MTTGISWTDDTWNPTVGCSRVSPGCYHCYAEHAAAMVNRTQGARSVYLPVLKYVNGDPRWNGEVRLIPERLSIPFDWKRPRRIFVNSMSDLFHDELADADIDRVFVVMLLSPHHTFQVLTKRAARMQRYMSDPKLYDRILAAAEPLRRERPELGQVGISNPATFPARWIWLGVSVENQDAADERVPELLKTPAGVRFLSCEPLLDAVDLEHVQYRREVEINALAGTHGVNRPHGGQGPRVDLVIAGCESGAGARPCEVAWLRSLRDQCARHAVHYFLKQAIQPSPIDQPAALLAGIRHFPPTASAPEGSRLKRGGVVELPYLDGVQHASMPEVRR